MTVRIIRKNTDESPARHRACPCDIAPDDCPMARELCSLRYNDLKHLKIDVRNVMGLQLMIFAALITAIILR